MVLFIFIKNFLLFLFIDPYKKFYSFVLYGDDLRNSTNSILEKKINLVP